VPSLEVVERFTHLKELSFPTPFLFPDDEEAHDTYVVDDDRLQAIDPDLPNTILSSQVLGFDYLRSLTVDEWALPGIPVRILSSLEELTVCLAEACEELGLDLVFRHANQLQSLTIYGFIERSMISQFMADADALPALHSFRLSTDQLVMPEPPESHVLEDFFNFIGQRKGLRRLYLRLPSLLFSEEDVHYFDFIAQLRRLEVFGFHTGLTQVDEHFLHQITSRLPTTLSAFHLGMDWNGASLLPLVSSQLTLCGCSWN